MIRLYFHHTPNPMKILVFLEAGGLDYELVPTDIFTGAQHHPAFRKLNPNGRVPVIEVDGDTVFDSGAILLYLSEKHRLLEGRSEDRASLLSWAFWVSSGLGPFSGQYSYYGKLTEGQTAPAERFGKQTHRHYSVLDRHLGGRDWIVGEGMTIADIAAWGWIERAEFLFGADALAPYRHLTRWFRRMDGQPAVARARAQADAIKDQFKADFDDEARTALFETNI